MDVFRTAVPGRSVGGAMKQGAHAFSDVIRLSNLGRGRSELGGDARVYRRFEQFTATTSFTFLELESGLAASGSTTAKAQLIPIEECDWPGHTRKA